uniref:Uncharacterized protein n=1 Tax=Romanomermis culicivorax TaxID=13658 RepID=A0A915L7N3_ROMCU
MTHTDRKFQKSSLVASSSTSNDRILARLSHLIERISDQKCQIEKYERVLKSEVGLKDSALAKLTELKYNKTKEEMDDFCLYDDDDDHRKTRKSGDNLEQKRRSYSYYRDDDEKSEEDCRRPNVSPSTRSKNSEKSTLSLFDRRKIELELTIVDEELKDFAKNQKTLKDLQKKVNHKERTLLERQNELIRLKKEFVRSNKSRSRNTDELLDNDKGSKTQEIQIFKF